MKSLGKRMDNRIGVPKRSLWLDRGARVEVGRPRGLGPPGGMGVAWPRMVAAQRREVMCLPWDMLPR